VKQYSYYLLVFCGRVLNEFLGGSQLRSLFTL
jgi:hypothetical protein